MAITHQRFHIPDMRICDAAQINHILNAIDDRIAAGHGVYVHCWDGVGGTGMVIGCWLVRHAALTMASIASVVMSTREAEICMD